MSSILPLSAASKITSYQLITPNGLAIEIAQASHRINLINKWSAAVRPGSNILELGCGQGNCTAVLAEAVGPEGHIDAVDPAPPEYGSPFTLGQAQAHISASEVGDRVTWHRAAPQDFLSQAGEEGKTWDCAVLSHCIWYFSSPDVLRRILTALQGKVQRICVAEYALRASESSAVPHVLATLARATLEAHKPQSTANIQTPLAPEAIKSVAGSCGWQLESEASLVPDEGLLDGCWETGSVASKQFLEEARNTVGDEEGRVMVVLESARAAVLAAVDAVGGVKAVRTMDVWAGVFSTA